MQDNNNLYHKSDSKKVTLFHGFLNLCVISIIGFGLLSTTALVLANVEKGVASGNDSTIVNTLNNKGVALEKFGNDTGAIFFYKKALVIQPNNTQLLDNIGIALDSLGNYSGAIKYYEKVLAIRPNDTRTLDNIGIDLNNVENFTGAVEYFNRALAVNPNDEAALYNKGAALYHLGFPTF